MLSSTKTKRPLQKVLIRSSKFKLIPHVRHVIRQLTLLQDSHQQLQVVHRLSLGVSDDKKNYFRK